MKLHEIITEAEGSKLFIAVEYPKNIVLYSILNSYGITDSIALYDNLEKNGLDVVVLDWDNKDDGRETANDLENYPIVYHIPRTVDISEVEKTLRGFGKSVAVKQNKHYGEVVRALEAYDKEEGKTGVPAVVPQLTGGGRGIALTGGQLKQLHSKHPFVPCKWWSEYDHECEVGVLIDIPKGLSKDQISKLVKIGMHPKNEIMQNYNTDMIYDMFNSNADFEEMLSNYDPGIQFRKGKCVIYQYKTVEWLEEINRLGDGIGDELD